MVMQTYTSGTNAIAAPIRHARTQAVSGVVVIAGPSTRFTEERMVGLSASLLEAARELALLPLRSGGVFGGMARSAA